MNPEEIIGDVEFEEVDLVEEGAAEVPAAPSAPGTPQGAAPETAVFDEMLDSSAVPAQTPGAPAPATPPPAQAIVCNHCGYNQTSGSKFCDGCGQRIDARGFLPKADDGTVDYGPQVRTIMVGDEEWPLCGDCGTANRPGQVICRQCQVPLKKRELF